MINLPLVAASILIYSSGVASTAAQDYTRVARLFRLDGERISSVGGPAPIRTILAPNPRATGLSTPHHRATVTAIPSESLGVGADVIEDAWQLFEILRLATQLMGDGGVPASAEALALQIGALLQPEDTTPPRMPPPQRTSAMHAITSRSDAIRLGSPCWQLTSPTPPAPVAGGARPLQNDSPSK